MRFVFAVLALVLASLSIGSRDATASPDGKRVALLGTSNANPYIGAWNKTFIKFATDAGMKVTNLVSNYDAAVQSQQIDDAIAQKFDMIVLVYVNDQAVVPALTRAKAAGIPVVLIVTPLKKDYEELFTSYVGTDHRELGRLAGEGMVKGLMAEGKAKAQIVAVTGAAQQLNVQDRIAAFKEVLAKHPGFELVAAEDGKWNTALTEKITGELLVRFNARGGVDGIFAMADNQATGSIQAVEFGRPQARRRGQGDRRRRQQLHEGRHDQHQIRQAVRHRDANPDRRGRDHREEGRWLFQRREDEEIRTRAGAWDQQGEPRAVHRRLLVLASRVQRYPYAGWTTHSRCRRGDQAVWPERGPQERHAVDRGPGNPRHLRRERRGQEHAGQGLHRRASGRRRHRPG